MKKTITGISSINFILIILLSVFIYIYFNKQTEKINTLEKNNIILEERIHTLSIKSLDLNPNLLRFETVQYLPDIKGNPDLPDIMPIRKTRENKITCLYGMRLNPFNGLPEQHSGIDIVTEWKGEILTTANGYVYKQYYSDITGLTVIMFHPGSGYFTLYGHLKESYVKINQYIKKGDVIGRQGGTGLVTGDHLHYEIFIDQYDLNNEETFTRKINYDPLLFIKGYYNEY